MVAAGVAGLVLGCLLGLRFRVLVLLPVEVAALAAGIGAAACGSVTGTAALEAFALFSTSLQVSYIVAVTLPSAARRPARAAEA